MVPSDHPLKESPASCPKTLPWAHASHPSALLARYGLTTRQRCMWLGNCCENRRLQHKLPSAFGLQVQGPAILLLPHKQRTCFRKHLECQLAAPNGAPGRRKRSQECSPPLLLRKQDFSSSGADESLKLFNLRYVIKSLITVMPKGI